MSWVIMVSFLCGRQKRRLQVVSREFYSCRTNVLSHRPAVQVFLVQPTDLLCSDPSLTKLARCPAEIGRIEFKACDRCVDFSLYVALLALLKGLALDDTLKAQATVPDRSLHQRAARFGFAQDDLFVGSQTVLNASAKALSGDPDVCFLEPLYYLPQSRITPAHRLAQSFHETNSIERVLRVTYQEIPVPIGGNARLV